MTVWHSGEDTQTYITQDAFLMFEVVQGKDVLLASNKDILCRINNSYKQEYSEKATCGNFRKNRYIKITWDKSKEKFTLVFNAKGDEARPSFAATFKRNGTLFGELTSVVPSPTKRRCTASYCNFFPISAALTKTATKYQDFSETKYQNQGLCFRSGAFGFC